MLPAKSQSYHGAHQSLIPLFQEEESLLSLCHGGQLYEKAIFKRLILGTLIIPAPTPTAVRSCLALEPPLSRCLQSTLLPSPASEAHAPQAGLSCPPPHLPYEVTGDVTGGLASTPLERFALGWGFFEW